VAIHPDLEPLAFLLGRWEGAGIGGYPTIESFRFGQEISFSHNGKPFLIYTSRTWRLDEEGQIGPPLGTESGYWRPRPDSQVEVMLAHPTGIVEIYLGEITGTRIEMATDVIAAPPRPRRSRPGTGCTGWWAPAGPQTRTSPTPTIWPRSARNSSHTCRPSSSASAWGNSRANKNKSPGDSGTGTLVPLPGPTGQGRPARGLGVCQVLAGRRPTGRHAGG